LAIRRLDRDATKCVRWDGAVALPARKPGRSDAGPSEGPADAVRKGGSAAVPVVRKTRPQRCRRLPMRRIARATAP